MIESVMREDFAYDLPGLHIGATALNLLGSEMYLWATVDPAVKLSVLRTAQKKLAEISDVRFVINVDSRKESAVRFAAFFGFVVTGAQGPILIMEKN